jgi:hypothetical protein
MTKITNITRQNLYTLIHTELGLPKIYCTNFVDDIFANIINGISKEKKLKYLYLVPLRTDLKTAG